jgi:hypothetical protein
MNRLTDAQIAQLAPDAAALKAGKDLANERKWNGFAYNHRVLWGEIQGSGKDPYRTQVDLTVIAFQCSCPSRKFPCKHGIALLYLFGNKFPLFKENNEEPKWVNDWIQKRQEKSANLAESNAGENGESDAKAIEKRNKDKAKRKDDRLALELVGAEELERFLKDLLRTGFLQLPEKGSAFFDPMARRMVDAKANGLANYVRNFNKINYFNNNEWQSKALQNALKAWTLIQAFKRVGGLEPNIQEQIFSQLGRTIKKKELLENPNVLTIKDQWILLGKLSEQLDDQMTMHRCWLLGCSTGKSAVLIDFESPFAPYEPLVLTGTIMEAELVFYPSNDPLRAQIKSQGPSSNQIPPSISFLADWTAAQEQIAKQIAISPWADDMPQLLQQLRLVKSPQTWHLMDQKGAFWPINPLFSENQIFYILAVTGAKPVDMGLLRMGDTVFPLGIFSEHTYQMIPQ